MTSSSNVSGVITSGASVATGVAALPATDGNPIVLALVVFAISVGAFMLISTLASKLYRIFS